MTTIKFASLPIKYAPKRKLINFALPQWHATIGEFQHPDVVSWINNVYQDKTFKNQKDFNQTYDAHLVEVLHWRNKPMVITKDDVEHFENEFNEGAFDEVQTDAQKILTKMKAVLETGEKIIFVY